MIHKGVVGEPLKSDNNRIIMEDSFVLKHITHFQDAVGCFLALDHICSQFK
jgi:hypothetical protein